jgi:hypothetical protein
MNSSRAGHYVLMVWLIILVGTTSCRVRDVRATARKCRSSEIQVDEKYKRMLSMAEIIQAANAAAIEKGVDPAKCDVFYDEGNARWRQLLRKSLYSSDTQDDCVGWREIEDEEVDVVIASRWPELKGRDYQAVLYRHRPFIWNGVAFPSHGEGVWVMIDKHTGEAL